MSPAIPSTTPGETAQLKRLTNGSTLDDALNAICPYWTMFPLEFPLAALAHAKNDEVVLDPFCGRGTTLFAARKLGLRSVGIDSNDVAVAIARAKLVSPRPSAITDLAVELLKGEPGDLPEGRFWTLAFESEVLADICRLRSGVRGRDDSVAAGLRGILLGCLHGPVLKGDPSYLSNQMPRTYSTKPAAAVAYWERHELVPKKIAVIDVIRRHANRRYSNPPVRVESDVWVGDAIDVLPRLRRKFSRIVTSPPYPGMVTYRPDGWLRQWILGGPAEPSYDRTAQLGAFTGSQFVSRLAMIWGAVAEQSTPGAQMTIRFGALPSFSSGPPDELLIDSLEASGHWAVTECSDAGTPPRRGARQASQLLRAGDHVPEVDVVAHKTG